MPHTHRSLTNLVLTLVVLLAVAAAGPQPAGARAPRGHAASHRHHRVHHHRASPIAATVSAPATPAPPVLAAVCVDGDLVPAPENLDRIRTATLCLINQQRAAQGLAPLRENADLRAAAQRQSADMVARNYFDHVGPTGVGLLDRVLAAGFAAVGSVLALGENIAAGRGSLATPAATVANWMNSSEHRANILNPAYTDTGIGVVAAAPALLGGGGSGATYSECFGATQ